MNRRVKPGDAYAFSWSIRSGVTHHLVYPNQPYRSMTALKRDFLRWFAKHMPNYTVRFVK